MLTRHILMAFVSFACGVAVSAGTFAFILVIGVVPRMIRKMNLADKVIYGFVAGMFVGCIAVALAEILNTFPILFRRLYINRGLSFVMIAMALGKTIGSLYYFFFGYGLPKYW